MVCFLLFSMESALEQLTFIRALYKHLLLSCYYYLRGIFSGKNNSPYDCLKSKANVINLPIKAHLMLQEIRYKNNIDIRKKQGFRILLPFCYHLRHVILRTNTGVVSSPYSCNVIPINFACLVEIP